MELESRGVGFKSLTESIDTTTSGGKLIFSIFSAPAPNSSANLIREHTYAGLAAAKACGRTGGRPRKMTQSKIEQAKRMRENGMQLLEIAEILGVGRTTFRHLK